jgi:hypothetical protein
VLAVDQLAVDLDVEYSAAALDELRFDAARLLDRRRQTGGLRAIISLSTIRNADFHAAPPLAATQSAIFLP